MKTILEFNLDDPDDCMAHMRYIRSLDMASVLFEIIYNTRGIIEADIEKADEKKINFDASDALEDFYNVFSQLLEEHHIDIDELIK